MRGWSGGRTGLGHAPGRSKDAADVEVAGGTVRWSLVGERQDVPPE